MLVSAEVKQLPARPCAYIPVRVRREDIRTVMGPGLQELHAELRSQGVAPAGPWFTHHPRMDPEYFELEISVPVGSSISSRGRVCSGEWPAMRAAVAVYRGPYEGLGAAWGEFKAWMAEQGVTQGPGGLWECYRVGPESGPDASRYETELVVPVAP
ncbi:MAG: hypothetical protein RL653_970 [Pseudomonadota bacterium]|jgi:effector-binding domain-containing protein